MTYPEFDPQEGSEVVVVTGASAGIGRAIVREFAQRGASIALLARNADGLEAARREVETLGGRALPIITDVAEWEQVEAAAEQVEDTFGPIDIWINNAMASVLATFEDITPSEYRRVTEVTYLGQVNGARAALSRMRKRDRGSIVFVGSALAYRGIPLQTAYCGAKHATQGFYESLRSELMHEKSRVKISMVHLPGVNTTQFQLVRNKLPNEARPMGTIFQPEVAARAIVNTAYSPQREVYVGLPTLQTILGNKLLPGVVDWIMAKTGFDGQQIDQPKQQRPDYLWKPVPGDHGSHGAFDDRAKSSAIVMSARHFRMATAAALAGVIIGGAMWINASLQAAPEEV